MKNVLGSKEFWKTSDKSKAFSQISIEKNNRIISDDFGLSEEFSTFFEYAVRSLCFKPDEFYKSGTENLSDSVDIAIRNFENNRSVQAIKQNILVDQDQDFYFSNNKIRDILIEITALNN